MVLSPHIVDSSVVKASPRSCLALIPAVTLWPAQLVSTVCICLVIVGTEYLWNKGATCIKYRFGRFVYTTAIVRFGRNRVCKDLLLDIILSCVIRC